MQAVYWALVILIAALASLFAASNREIVSLGLWPLPILAEAPLYLIVLLSLLFGFLAGVIVAWLKGGRRRRELRECRRRTEALARELTVTQEQLAREGQAMPAALPHAR